MKTKWMLVGGLAIGLMVPTLIPQINGIAIGESAAEVSEVSLFNENVWTSPIVRMGEIDTSIRESESEWIKGGIADFSDVISKVYDRTNQKYGTSVQPEVTK